MPEGRMSLTIPLDATAVPDRGGAQKVKVAIMDAKGRVQTEIAAVNDKGIGEATFKFNASPGSLQVAVGPDSAGDDELFALQTITLSVSARQFALQPVLKLPPLKIPPFYWHWWRRWCFTFTISGRIVCPDGRPVPGAKVCAYDVDWWWIWSGLQLVGCDTTDANGAFSMRVRWCCGWLPWYWWRLRLWSLEPPLLEKIRGALRLTPIIDELPDPPPRPTLKVFRKLLDDAGINPQPLPPRRVAVPERLLPPVLQPTKTPDDVPLELADFDKLRDRLLQFLPPIPELERLQVWPWFRWHPWWDCRPDIIFRATQDCEGRERTVVNETIFNARLNVSSDLQVTLVAQDACCIQDHPDPEGNCVVLSAACGTLLNDIGGNIGAAAAPVGYASPGVASPSSDRPFSEDVVLSGLFGTGATADYYEFEWAPYAPPAPPPAAYGPMPPPAAGGFSRTFFGPGFGGAPGLWHSVPFNFQPISGRNVIESREHFEANNDPLTWGVTRFWVSNRDVLMVWKTKGIFADDAWSLRLKSYPAAGAGLGNPEVLPICNTNNPNTMVLRIDNREILTGPPPTSPGQPCGSGTVHVCTTEPDTRIIEVRVDGRVVGPCGNEQITASSVVEIDFMVYDPDGHLHSYTFVSLFGVNQVRNLLNPAAGTLQTGVLIPPLPGPVAAAAQVGPNYLAAIGQGATRPIWQGGTMRLRITQPLLVFPQTCAYQIRLRGFKRNIVSCHYGPELLYQNESSLTFTLVV